MAPEETTELVQHLERSRQEFIAAVGGIQETQAAQRPDPARWSVLECVEHVTSVEERFLGWLEAAERLDAPRVDKEKEASLLTRVADRSTRIQAPETAWPRGRFATLGEALDQFNVARTRSIQFAQERYTELPYIASAHPRLGPMNGVEFLVIIAAHARRHAEQIRETRAAIEKT